MSRTLADAATRFVRTAELGGAAAGQPGGLTWAYAEDRGGVLCLPPSLRSWAHTPDSAASGRSLRLYSLPFRWETYYRSAYADDRLNGPLWAGRGFSHRLAGGAELEWGPLTLVLRPEAIYEENREFPVRDSLLVGSSPFRYPWHSIDWPYRPGPGDDLRIEPGQSALRLDAGAVAAGVSTGNVWWGPATRYPLLLGNTAPGFRHAFVGTGRPLDAGFVRLGARALWGLLEESDHFDASAANDRRLLQGVTLTLEPTFVRGLSVGAASLYQRAIPPRGLGLDGFVDRLPRPLAPTTGDSLDADAVGSLFVRWVRAESGFEVYWEWGKEDLSESLRQLFQEPDHAQAYTLGLAKLWETDAGWSRFRAEITHRQASVTARGARPFVTWGADGGVPQGHTHRGQPLGGFIGPGSDAQFLGLDLYRDWGSVGAYLERIRRDDDAYHRNLTKNYGVHGHDVEVAAGLRGSLLLDMPADESFPGSVRVDWDARLSSRTNRQFVGLRPPNTDLREDTQWAAELGLSWRPGQEPRPSPESPHIPGTDESGAERDPAETRCASPRRGRVVSLSGRGSDQLRMSRITGHAEPGGATARRPTDLRRLAVCADSLPEGLPARDLPEPAPLSALPRVEPLAVTATGTFRSAYPVNRNNGGLWSGRGFSGGGSLGLELRWGPLSAAAWPRITATQNRSFDLPLAARTARDSLRYPWHRLDLPLRFGTEGFTELHAGESYARLDAAGLAAGISTEHVWWGPGRRFPITMGTSAPGFPHVFFRTAGPLNIGIGQLEGEVLWGELSESEHYDSNPDNDRRLLGGITLAFSPDFAPGLSVGGNSLNAKYVPPGEEPTPDLDFLNLPFGSSGRQEQGNSFGSLFFRWALPESGFEVYGEWGRDDFNANVSDFLKEPDHSQVYMLGLQNVWEEPDRRVRLAAELAHLEAAISFRAFRDTVTYYTHRNVRQGHTHEGQMLGAWIGPGADAQFLAADVFHPWGSVGGYLERVRRDDNAYYQEFGEFGARGHDVELTLAARGTLTPEAGAASGFGVPGALDVEWELGVSRRSNRNFVGLAEHEGPPSALDPRVDVNLFWELGLAWWPGR